MALLCFALQTSRRTAALSSFLPLLPRYKDLAPRNPTRSQVMQVPWSLVWTFWPVAWLIAVPRAAELDLGTKRERRGGRARRTEQSQSHGHSSSFLFFFSKVEQSLS